MAKAAQELITCRDVLARFGRAIEADGLVEETDNAKLLYLALASRLFDWRVSVVLKGVSAGGKSVTVEKTLAFFPTAAYYARTGLSDHALIFEDEEFRHRHIVIYEAAGMDSERLSYFIRTLLSERRISHQTVQKTSEGLRPYLIEKEGPTGLITTTTQATLHPENETRMLSLSVKDTADQTKAVFEAIARDDGTASDHSQWVAFQQWLELGERRVTIPFAMKLAKAVKPVAVRLRRDFRTILTLVKAHALLHRSSRAKDEDGRILATIVDYAAVHALLRDLITEGAGSSVHSTVRETVNAAFELLAEKEAAKAAKQPVDKEEAKRPVDISHTEIAKALGLDRSAAWRRVKRAMSEGYLQNLENNQRKKARIVLGDPMPGHEDVLPKPDDIMDIDEKGSETSAHAQRVGNSAEKSNAYPLQADMQQPPGPAQLATDGAGQRATDRTDVAHEVATDMPLRSQ